MNKAFLAYANETDSFTIGEMTVENRLDRISIYGSVDLTKDKLGLESAMRLKRIVDASIEALRRERDLPDNVLVDKPDVVDNPFQQASV